MSRIGRKPIPLPKGVVVKIEGDVINVQGPKGTVLIHSFPAVSHIEQQDGNLLAVRENDSQAAVHGLARALVNNGGRRCDPRLDSRTRDRRHRIQG